MRLLGNTFNLVADKPGFSWDLSLVPCYYLVLIVNPMAEFWFVAKVLERISSFLLPYLQSAVYIYIWIIGCENSSGMQGVRKSICIALDFTNIYGYRM